MMTEDRFARFEERFERFVEYVESRFQDTEGRLRELPTREEWSQFATKADLAQFATKAELTGEIGALRAEMRERFENVHDRLVALEKGQADLRTDLRSGLAQLRQQANELSVWVDRLEALARENNSSLLVLREDMLQRFRHVNERLTALEQKLAA
jgi:hypothetical protein